MKLLFIDNQDSFSFNIVDLFCQLPISELEVVDSTWHRSIEEWCNLIASFTPTHVVVGPGPGSPGDLPLLQQLILLLEGKVPLLGICLGHQLIIEAYGGKVVPTGIPVHGKQSSVSLVDTESKIFKGIPSPFIAGRYHSLAALSVQPPLKITAKVSENDPLTPHSIMAVEHIDAPTYGIQFHPESFLSEHGLHIFNNFIEYGRP